MTAVFFGLATAVAWAVTSLCSARASRMMGAAPTLAWVSLLGLIVSAPLAVVESRPGVDPIDIGWLALAGLGNVIGLLLLYAAVRHGKVGITAPIASTEGARAQGRGAARRHPIERFTARRSEVQFRSLTEASCPVARSRRS